MIKIKEIKYKNIQIKIIILVSFNFLNINLEENLSK